MSALLTPAEVGSCEKKDETQYWRHKETEVDSQPSAANEWIEGFVRQMAQAGSDLLQVGHSVLYLAEKMSAGLQPGSLSQDSP